MDDNKEPEFTDRDKSVPISISKTPYKIYIFVAYMAFPIFCTRGKGFIVMSLR